MELGPSPCPGAVPSCRDGCLHLPACTEPRLPEPLGTRAHNRDADPEHRWLWDGLFCLSAVEQLGPLWIQGFISYLGILDMG